MNHLAETLRQFLRDHFEDRLKRNLAASYRPILVGPPAPCLSRLYEILTDCSKRDWSVQMSDGNQVDVAVLLVQPTGVVVRNNPLPNVVSRPCAWDYAVTVRNSRHRVLVLAESATWASRPESLANTTETIGEIRLGGKGRWFTTDVWNYIISSIASHIGVEPARVRTALREVAKTGDNLNTSDRATMPWTIADALLADSNTDMTPANRLCLQAGFPSVVLDGELNEAHQALSDLARYLAETGLDEGIQNLKATTVATGGDLGADLDALAAHVRERALSGPTFNRSPAWFYRAGAAPPAWWTELSAGCITEMVGELAAPQRPGRIKFVAQNALNDPVPGEPVYVHHEVQLGADATGEGQITSPQFSRRIGQASTSIPSDPNDPLQCLDPSPPAHVRPIKYQVDAQGFRPATLDIVSLATFECRGTARVENASRARVPMRPKGRTEWVQEITLQRAGVTDLNVLFAEEIARLRLSACREGGPERLEVIQVEEAAQSCRCVVEVEDQDNLLIELLNPADEVVANWTVVFDVDQTATLHRSRFEALLMAHQGTRQLGIAQAPDSFIQRLEAHYLSSPHDLAGRVDSWKPLLACWKDASPVWLDAPDWSSDPVIGDVDISLDPRPTLSPPARLLEAREAVRSHLEALARPIAEMDLGDERTRELVSGYLSEYESWLDQNPEHATWFDCLAVHAPVHNPQAGGDFTSPEPIAIVLSPMHPLRLSWHCVAQEMLSQALGMRCPAAGLIDPHRCPDIGAWYFSQGGAHAEARAFYGSPARHPHWQVLWNRNYLGGQPERTIVALQLSAIGIGGEPVTGGFTQNQTVGSLNELSKLLPARAVLRAGIVSSGENMSACTDGVISWCETNFDEPDGAQPPITVNAIEVYDFRDQPALSSERIANLSEQTQERVRWYFETTQSPPRQDLVIVDQLGGASPRGRSGPIRSPMTEGALWRNRVRQDTQGGVWLHESRIGMAITPAASLAEIVARATSKFESLAEHDQGTTQLQFQPDVDTMRSRLAHSIYLAITTSQIDPACIIKGAASTNSYLWDYQLPGGLSGEYESPGYYLIAQPSASMRMAIKQAVGIVTSTNVDDEFVNSLIGEISHRGIPVLKRLATGGTHASGELGMLLTVRLLQDAFRGASNNARLRPWIGRCLHLLLPVDPYQDVFRQLGARLRAGQGSDQRPDLLAVAIQLPDGDEAVSIKLTPIEVKLRQHQQIPATELREMLKQAENLGQMLNALLVKESPNPLWNLCGRAVLSRVLDLAFRIYANEDVHGRSTDEWTAAHARVLRDVLWGHARCTVVTAGKLIVFDQSIRSGTSDLDGDGRLDTLVIAASDAESILMGSSTLSAEAHEGVFQLDLSYPDCTGRRSVESRAEESRSDLIRQDTSDDAAEAAPAIERMRTVSPRDDSSSPSIAVGNLDQARPLDVTPSSTNTRASLVENKSNVQGVPAEVRRRVEQAFDGFIGNEDAVRLIKYDLLLALMGDPVFLSKNYLFTGQPSTGKTEMARRIALALDLPMVRLDGRGVGTRERLFELVKGELVLREEPVSQVGQMGGLAILQYPPLAVFIDEIHLVPRAVQESFLTVLEAADRTVTLKDEVARMDKVTFLFATTRASALDRAFRTRCREIQLREYTEAEVSEIVARKKVRSWPDETCLAIARLGRCVPRVAMEIADQLETVIAVSAPADLSEHLAEVRRSLGIDEIGLTEWDVKYLDILERHGRLGERPLLSLLGSVDRDRVIEEIEPFLTRLGLLRLTPGGRELTQEGRDYVLRRRRDP